LDEELSRKKKNRKTLPTDLLSLFESREGKRGKKKKEKEKGRRLGFLLSSFFITLFDAPRGGKKERRKEGRSLRVGGPQT